MRKNNGNVGILLLLIAIGAIIGGLIGDLFKDYISIFKYSRAVGFEPITMDFAVMKLTFGMLLQLNITSIIGMMLAIVIYKRL